MSPRHVVTRVLSFRWHEVEAARSGGDGHGLPFLTGGLLIGAGASERGVSAVRLGGRPTKVTVSDQFTSAVSTLGAVTVTPSAPVQTCLTADLLNNGCLLTAPANGQLILNEEGLRSDLGPFFR